MKPNLSFLNRFSMKTRVYIVGVLILALAAGGTLSLLAATGKLGTKADAILKTVNASGKVTDASTGAALPNFEISVSSFGGPSVIATTDSSGNYHASFAIDTNIPQQNIITVQSQNINLEDTSYQQNIPTSSLANVNLTQNLSIYNPPKDSPSTTTLDPVSQKCKTSPPGPNDFYYYYHDGDYYGEYIHGVLFCVSLNEKSIMANYRPAIEKNADQLNFLSSQTGVWIPTIYLVQDINGARWDGNPIHGYYNYKDITLDVDYINPPYLVTHEFGHHVDWTKGFDSDVDNDADDRFCRDNPAKTKSHCFTSDQDSFKYSASIVQKKSINGYATVNAHEVFADTFAAILFWPQNSFNNRFKLQYAIANMMLGGYSIPFVAECDFPDSSIFSSYKATFVQNSSMYIYKHVTNYSNLDQYFPGTLKKDWAYNDIWYGKYMDVGVVSFTVDAHAVSIVQKKNRLPDDQITSRMDSTTVTIGGASQSTRIKKKEGVFPDGSGDLFNTSGTNIILNTPTGKGKLVDVSTPNYYTGATWLGKKVDTIQGSNLLPLQFVVHTDQLDVQMQGMPFHPAWCMPNTAVHSDTIDHRNAAPIEIKEMEWFPAFGVSPIANQGSATCNQSQGSPYRLFVLGGDPPRWEESGMVQKDAAYGKAIHVTTPLATSPENPSIDIPVMEQNKTCLNDWAIAGADGWPPAEFCMRFKF